MLLFERAVEPQLTAISALRRDLVERLDKLSLITPLKNVILTIIAEIATNAVRHSFPKPTRLCVKLRLDGFSISVEVEDDGGAFDTFDQNVEAARSVDTASLIEGGRGLPLILSMMDKVTYSRGSPNVFSASRSLTMSKPTILVVEDSPLLLATYAAFLRSDYRVLTAGDLMTAIKMSNLEQIDGIVTDLHLGEEDGSALAALTEEHLERPPVPMLLITGDRTAVAAQKAAAAGFELVLLKPVSGVDMKNAVQAMLARSARTNARVFRYFGGAIDADPRCNDLGETMPFRLRLLQGKAAFGTGDFWLKLAVPSGQRFVLGDVMGHGLAAQLGGLKLKSAIQGIHGAFATLEPGELLAAISRSIANETIASSLLVTLLVIDFNEDGRIRVAGAGHPRPLVHSAKGSRFIQTDGPLPGIFDDSQFSTIQFELGEGERMLLMTDGVDCQAPNTANLAPSWLIDALDSTTDVPFPLAIDVIEAQMRSNLTASPVDDWTAVVIEPTTHG